MPLAVLVRFVTDHLEGLPLPVDTALVAEGAKARLGTHSMATVSRRLAVLAVTTTGAMSVAAQTGDDLACGPLACPRDRKATPWAVRPAAIRQDAACFRYCAA